MSTSLANGALDMRGTYAQRRDGMRSDGQVRDVPMKGL